MKISRPALPLAALVTLLTLLPVPAQNVGRIRRSLDRATGGQTAAPARPAPAPPVAPPANAAALQAAQAKRNQEAAVGAEQRVVDFLRQRVEGGSADAAFDLAKRYETGQGVKADPKEARRLHELASVRGHAEAKAWLQEHPAPAATSIPTAGPAPAPRPSAPSARK